jgi:hypothetical protein
MVVGTREETHKGVRKEERGVYFNQLPESTVFTLMSPKQEGLEQVSESSHSSFQAQLPNLPQQMCDFRQINFIGGRPQNCHRGPAWKARASSSVRVRDTNCHSHGLQRPGNMTDM